ncbi:hypothetical protein EON80_27995 [bacterium]|nr:MAG: hypothetical protein EON80_27995 [bacterium]
MKEHAYIGPPELLSLIGQPSTRRGISDVADFISWVEATQQAPDENGEVIVTFIINTVGQLWIADRRSEHVVCAAGEPVLSAGEMTFRLSKNEVEVTAATNQSTGFCPEPESWAAVGVALDKLGLSHPGGFTTAFHFRRCRKCDSINLVKEEWFVCGVCDGDLEREWNLG